MKKATKLLGFLMALCLAGTVFTALHADAAQTSSKDELNIAMTTEPTNFDVQADSNPAATKVREQIFSRLVRVNADAEIEGDLAESWEISEDGLAITFHLRQGVKWHNGDDFNADDVIYSFARGSEVPYVTSGYDFVDYGATEKVDDYTVVLHLAYPYSTALRSLATQSVFMILHQASVEAAGDQMKYEPVGTGPYKFVSWITGDSITLEAFEDYWEGQVPIRDVIFHFVPEATQATIELETGDVDLQIIKEVFLPAFGELKDCLQMAAYIINKIEVNEHILDNPMYDPMFSVEEVNRLAAAGMPFRDAYKKVGLDIEAGTFKADKHIHHTHEGSIGNLCNPQIEALMQQTLDGFNFERMTSAENNLLK